MSGYIYYLPTNIMRDVQLTVVVVFFFFLNVSQFCPDLGGLHREQQAALRALYFTEGWSKNRAGTKHSLTV